MIQDTIIALSTPQGAGAIAVIRLSGSKAIATVNEVFYGKDLDAAPSHTLHFGTLRKDKTIIDEVVVGLYKAPRSYTKEDVVEISTHGSDYIVQQVIQLFLDKGIRLAEAGEFTKRAFLHGAMDLAQAEAVADLIASDSESAHQSAMHQMRGGFSSEIKSLRDQLIKFASLIELELDFGEEDVAFADRAELENLINQLKDKISSLITSFQFGNVLKNGVPIAIVGKPNAGKSTLLNALLNEEKAIVSDIAGTTRDFIEDEIIIEGIRFRFIDTAGLRETTDKVEAIGVQRSIEQMEQSSLILYLFDNQSSSRDELIQDINSIKEKNIPYVLVANKIDLDEAPIIADALAISALEKRGLQDLKAHIVQKVRVKEINTSQTVVTNARHYESLSNAFAALENVSAGLSSGISGDLLAMDIRQSLHYLGLITGEISTDDLLDSIFRDFCIGK